MTLKEKLKTLPSCPGVYLMKGLDQNIIYVGKSKNLKARVATYFQSPDPEDKKALKLYHSIKDFDILTTDTELEALLLECQLIQKYKPWCNRLMKSPESYVYIKITIADDFPDILLCEEKEEDGSLYFGPYTKRSTTDRAIDALRTIYKMPCTKYSRKKGSCMKYSLGKCHGICIGKITKDQHGMYIREITEFLRGFNTTLVDSLEKEMITASETFEFEQAAKLRDQITALSSLIRQAKLLAFAASSPLILVSETVSSNYGKVLLLSGNRLLYQKKISLDLNSVSASLTDMAAEVLESLPKEEAVQELTKQDIDEFRIVHSYLKQHENNCNYRNLSSLTGKNLTCDILHEILLGLFE